MALLPPIASYTLTQKYGTSALAVEPAMYGNSTRSYWQPFSGLKFYAHFHPALDMAAGEGTAIVASETGRVVESYFDKTNGGGNKVTVEIRPNVRYTSNHMAARWVSNGVWVVRGQTIGTVGHTGWSSGNHNHFQVSIREVDGAGVARTFLWNPSLFLPGGSMVGDPRITPLTAPSPSQAISINGPGINTRTTPDLDVGSGNVFSTTTTAGIVRNGAVIAPLNYKMKFANWVTNDDGTWAKHYLGGGWRYTKKELIHFV